MNSEMNSSEQSQRAPAFLGSIEPHAPLLRIPPENQLLYKVMTIENLLRSVTGNYLHFNRVDNYSDFPNADENDGRQLPKDQPANAATRLQTFRRRITTTNRGREPTPAVSRSRTPTTFGKTAQTEVRRAKSASCLSSGNFAPC